jgi:hypothetical protein
VKQVDIAAAMSASSFMRSLSSSISIVIGSVLLQKTLHGGKLIPDSDAEAVEGENRTLSSETSASALSVMWIFYCSMCGFMAVASLLIKRMPVQKVSGDQENQTGSESKPAALES